LDIREEVVEDEEEVGPADCGGAGEREERLLGREGEGLLKRDIVDNLSNAKRFRCVKLFTRCSAKIFSLGVFNDRLRSSLAVLSSLSFSNSSSS
jgi:hypothetical protein